jgi:hypothetical protein
MPALPLRRKAKPFKSQSTLKNPRTHSKLRTYAKRRLQYGIATVIVLCIFLSRYLPELRAWRKDQQRDAARPGNKLRKRRQRARQKLLAKQARLAERLAQCASKIAQAEERMRIKELNLRRHGTKHAGFLRGWTATEDLSPEEAKTWAKRYVLGFNEARAERQRVTVLMAAQQSKTVVQPTTIKL